MQRVKHKQNCALENLKVPGGMEVGSVWGDLEEGKEHDQNILNVKKNFFNVKIFNKF